MSQFAKESPVPDPPMLTAEEDPLMRALKRMENAIHSSQKPQAAPANLPVAEIVTKEASKPIEKSDDSTITASALLQGDQSSQVEAPLTRQQPAPAPVPSRRTRVEATTNEVERDDDKLIALGATDNATATRRSRNKRHGSFVGTLVAVFAIQGFLLTAFVGAIAFHDGFRGFVRTSVIKLLGGGAPPPAHSEAANELPSIAALPLVPPTDNGANLREISILSSQVQNLKKQLEEGPLNAQKELSLLAERNELISLADAAITRGDRGAYVRLEDLARSAPSEEIMQGAEAQILRVKFFYASGTRYGAYSLPMTQLYPELKSKAEEDLTVEQKIRLLLDENQDWRVRTRAAYLLGSERRSPRAAEALVQAIQTDGSLDVVKECTYSFEEITEKYRSPGLFEIDHLLSWWAGNKASFIQ